MKLSIAQFDVARGNPAKNLKQIAALAERARAAGSDLLCLPEMCTTGFDWSFNATHLDAASDDLARIAAIAQAEGLAICGSFLEKTESGRAANCFHYFDQSGQRLAQYRKLHLFTLFREERHVEAGDRWATFSTQFGELGAAICYDLRFPELFRQLTAAGAWLQLLPSAFPHPRLEHWRTLVRARAIENQVYLVAINQCGVEGHGGEVGETQYFGHSMVVDPWGEIIAEAGEAADLLEVEVDPAEVDSVRSKLSAWDDRRTDVFGKL
ncbi:MAG: carbon-nitrogen family hydrolase [Puniceicoccaceae bacterium]|nr:MAG: carbon-nitrogen family hydrolase [Puniceicoccaceae bacterium]